MSSSGAGGGSVLMPVFAIWRRMCSIGVLEVLSAVGKVERLVDQRKVGNDVADHRVLEHRPVRPRRIVRMAAADRAAGAAFERDQHGSAPAFDVAQALAERRRLGRAARRSRLPGSASTIARTRRSDSHDLVEAHRDARGDVAGFRASPCARRACRRAPPENRSAGRAPGRSRDRRVRSGRACAASSGVTMPQVRKRSCSPSCSS